MSISRVFMFLFLGCIVPLPAMAEEPDQFQVTGQWKGYFFQPGGPLNRGNFYADATLKQEKDAVAGEIRIAVASNPEIFHKMSVKGTVEKGRIVFKDDKVVEYTPVAPRWYNERTFTGQLSEFGAISGTWIDRTDEGANHGTFVFVLMEYAITIKRGPANNEGLVPSKLFVNARYIGDVFENPKYLIPAGEYGARRRFISQKDFVQGPGGAMGKTGDFLLEVAEVPKRTDILIHPGNKPEHSEGCVLAGPVSKKGKIVLAPALLSALRFHFYGSDRPTPTDPVYAEKEGLIRIKVQDGDGKLFDSTQKPGPTEDQKLMWEIEKKAPPGKKK